MLGTFYFLGILWMVYSFEFRLRFLLLGYYSIFAMAWGLLYFYYNLEEIYG